MLGKTRVRLSVVMYASIILLVVFYGWCWITTSSAAFSYNLEKGLFPESSVIDLKHGSLTSLFAYVNLHRITLVIFYAPWSGQCIKIVPEIIKFHSVIKHPLVNVIAINCWVGECRKKFSTLYFPRIFIYHTNHEPVEYVGDIKTSKILKFIRLSIRPWLHIGNQAEMKTFLNLYDSHILVYVDPRLFEANKRYDTILALALLLINRENGPKVGVVVNKDISLFVQFSRHGQVCSKNLYHDYLCYSDTSKYTAKDLLKWIDKHNKEQLVRILSPQHSKKYVEQFKKGPMIILVSSTTDREHSLVQLYQHSALLYYKCVPQDCTQFYEKPVCASYRSVHPSDVACVVCQYCTHKCLCEDKSFTFLPNDFFTKFTRDGCNSYRYPTYFYRDKFSTCCRRNTQTNFMNRSRTLESLLSASLLTKDQDNILNALNEVIKAKTKQFDTNSKPPEIDMDMHRLPSRFETSCGSLRNRNVTYQGLACCTNKTLNFFIMEFDRNSFILKKMGVTKAPSLLIVDSKEEADYVFDSDVTAFSVEKFILQYTLGELQQKFKSAGPPHKLPSNNPDVLVTELTTTTFKKEVFSLTKSVFVMFYTTWCGACKAVYLDFLKLAHTYRAHDVLFARINADVNNLPWHFVPNYYPSFILFPAHRKHDSVAYPDNEEIILGKLMKFLDSKI